MTSSKLALHILPGPSYADALINSANWAAVKAVNRTDALAVARDAGIAVRILRDTSTDAAGSADAVNRLLSYNLADVTALQICCESARGFDPVWQTEVYQGLRARGWGGVILAGAFATGNPTTITGDPPHFSELTPLYSLLRLPGVALALDAYTGVLSTDPRVPAWWPYTAQRHRLIIADLARQGISVPVYITESGGDSVQPEASGGGWQTRGWSAGDYLATLQALDVADQQDGALVCRCVFTSCPTPDWASYSIDPIADQLAAYVRQQAVVVPVSPVTTPATPAKKGTTMTRGMDVSNLQGAINWPQVANDVQFVAIKTTEGIGFADPYFAANWLGAKAAGLVRIAYHFARPDTGNSPEAEATYFLAHLTDLEQGDCLALDLELGSGDLAGWALSWLQAVHTAVGFAPWLYSYPYFITSHGLGTVPLATYPLWYASYQAGQPPTPGQWRALAVWQNTDAATVSGVAGQVDGDVTALTVDQLRGLGKPGPVPTVPATDPIEQEALDYYQQNGVKVDRSHAIWTEVLRPLYAFWKQLEAQPNPAISPDLVKPGTLAAPEYGTLWGNARPAGCVKLTNRIVGVTEDDAGHWSVPFQAYI